MLTEEEQGELLSLYKHLMGSLMDVRALKEKYETEYKIKGMRPAYDRKQTDKQIINKNFQTNHMQRRYSPDVGDEECRRIYDLMPEGWFGIHTVVKRTDLTVGELRRRFFWMRKRQMLKYCSDSIRHCKKKLPLKN